MSNHHFSAPHLVFMCPVQVSRIRDIGFFPKAHIFICIIKYVYITVFAMPDSSLKLLLEDPTDLGSQQSYLCCTKWSCANECICLSYFCFAFSSSSFHAKAEHSREHHTKRERESARNPTNPINIHCTVFHPPPLLLSFCSYSKCFIILATNTVKASVPFLCWYCNLFAMRESRYLGALPRRHTHSRSCEKYNFYQPKRDRLVPVCQFAVSPKAHPLFW